MLDSDRRRKRGLEGDDGGVGHRGRPNVAALVGGAVVLLAVFFVILMLLGARPLAAQGLADFDYENLSFRGVSADVGLVVPSARIEGTQSFGGRVDLGFLGPGVRVTAGFNRWSSYLTREEVGALEAQLERLIDEQAQPGSPSASVDLGRISWADFAINTDAHMMWSLPGGLTSYAGMGATAHIMQGGGAVIEDTFVEDLLSSIRAGVNAHAGVEVPVHRRLRLVGEARYEILEDLNYLQLRVGGQVMFGAWAGGAAR
ncbi:MAG: hypothetical protein WD960_03360 [Gemmatimonadota bacterium]